MKIQLKELNANFFSKLQNGGWIFPVLLMFGILLRILIARVQYAVSFDEIHYLQLAATSSAKGIGAGLHVFWSPFFPFVISILSRIIPDLEIAGRVVSICSGLLLSIVLFMFSRKYYGLKASYFTSVWALLLPSLAFIQITVLTESLFILLAISGVLFGWIVLEKLHWGWSGVVGLIFGMAYLTRPEGGGYLIVFAAVAFISGIYQLKKIRSWRLLLISGISVVVFCLTALPYLLFLRDATGKWTPSGKMSNQQGELYGENKGEDEVDIYRLLSEDNTTVPIDQLFHEGTFTQIHSGPDRSLVKVTFSGLVKKYIKNYYKMVKIAIPSALTTVLFIFTVLGFFSRSWARDRFLREVYFLTYIFFFWLLVVPAFHITERYVIPLLPICFIWAGEGMSCFYNWVLKTHNKINSAGTSRLRPGIIGYGLLVIIFLGGSFLPELGKYIVKNKYDTNRWAPPVEQKIAGEWLKKNTDGVPRIISRYHTVNFYAANYDITEAIDIPLNDINRIYEYAQHKKVEYLVINQRHIMDNPNMEILLQLKDVPDFLEPVYDETVAPGLRTVIYRFKY